MGVSWPGDQRQHPPSCAARASGTPAEQRALRWNRVWQCTELPRKSVAVPDAASWSITNVCLQRG
jgi:hypothetical protein